MNRRKQKNSAKQTKPSDSNELNSEPSSGAPTTSDHTAPKAQSRKKSQTKTRARSPSPDFATQYAQLLKESDMIPPEPKEPLPFGGVTFETMTPEEVDECCKYIAMIEDEDSMHYDQFKDEYEMWLQAAKEIVPETEEDIKAMEEIWESLRNTKENITPAHLKERFGTMQPCSSAMSSFLSHVGLKTQEYRRYPDTPPQPSTSRSFPNVGPSSSQDRSPSYSPSDPLDGEGEQCSSELRGITDDGETGSESYYPSPVNSSESEPEIRVVNEIKALPHMRAKHQRFERSRRVRTNGGIHQRQEPIDVNYGYEVSSASQQPCSSSHTESNNGPCLPRQETIIKGKLIEIDFSVLDLEYENEEVASDQQFHEFDYEKELSNLTAERSMLIAENMELDEKLMEIEKQLQELRTSRSETTKPAQPPSQSTNKNKKKKKKKAGKK